ncbi:MAG: hypothetical protein JO307_28545, partial [Bryobacterales bacterium]|nr:hypothetical protein [Bryobacterales bacterium]
MLLLIPILLLTPAAYYYAGKLPRSYRAKALVGSESPLPGLTDVGNRIDPGTVNAQEQLRAIQETILVPDVLKRVVAEFDLTNSGTPSGLAKWFPWRTFVSEHTAQLRFFHLDGIAESLTDGPEAQTPPSLEKSAENLKSDIQIQVESPTSFYLAYENPNPELSARVTNRLASIFVDRTSRLRTEIVRQEDNVLDAEVSRTRGQLANAEDALRSYKERTNKQVPERFSANVKQLEEIQTQIQSRTDKITEGEARRASIQEEMSSLEKQGVLKQEPAPKTPAQIALEDRRMKLNQLKSRYKPEYPEIAATEREIHDLERVASSGAAAAETQRPNEAQMRYYALKSELASIEPRLATYRKEREALISQMPEYQKRIDSSPGSEAAVSEMTKDTAM